MDTLPAGFQVEAEPDVALPEGFSVEMDPTLDRLPEGFRIEKEPYSASADLQTTKREVSKAPMRAFNSTLEAVAGLRSFVADLFGNKDEAQKWRDAVALSQKVQQPMEGETYDTPGVLAQDPAVYGGSLGENPSAARLLGNAAPSMLDTAAAIPFGTSGVGFLTLKETMPYYLELRQKGVAPGKAMAAAAMYGAGTFLMEKFGLDALRTGKGAMKDGVKAAAKEFAAGVAKEGGTEALQQAWQNAVAEGFDGSFDDWKDFRKQVGEALADPEAWSQLGKDLTEGVVESGVVGAMAGAPVKGGTMTLAKVVARMEGGKSGAAPTAGTTGAGPLPATPMSTPASELKPTEPAPRPEPVAAVVAKYANLPNAKAYAEAYADWREAGKEGKRPKWKTSDIVARKIRVEVDKALGAVEQAKLKETDNAATKGIEQQGGVGERAGTGEGGVSAEAGGGDRTGAGGQGATGAPEVRRPVPARLAKLVESYTLPTKKQYARAYWEWLDQGSEGKAPKSNLNATEREKVRKAVDREWETTEKGYDRIEPSQLDRARAFYQSEVQPGQTAALAGNYGRTAIHSESGEFLRKVNLGRAYPEGWDGESAGQLQTALADIAAGKDPTAAQKKIVLAAAAQLERADRAETEFMLNAADRPGRREVVPASSLPDGALVYRDGEWRMAKGNPDTETVQLKDGTTEELGPQQTTEAAAVVHPGDKGYGDALRSFEEQERKRGKATPPVPSGTERGAGPQSAPADLLDKAESAVDARLDAMRKEGRLYSGLDPELFALWTAKGAIKIARGVRDFGQWAAEMVREFGETIRPHLQRLWTDAQKASATIGRPDLANPGRTDEVRAAVDAIDQMRNEAELPETKREAAAVERATARVGANLAAERTKLLANQWFGLKTGQDDTAVAAMLVNEMGTEALRSGNDESMRDFIVGVFNYREGGADLGRAMAMRRDRNSTPAERNKRLIMQALASPSEVQRNAMRQAIETGDTQFLDAIAERTRKAQAELAEMGYDLGNLDAETLNDPAAVAEIVRTAQRHHANFGDMVLEYWLNVGLLGSPKTIIQNLGGTYAHVMWTHTVDRMAQGLVNTVLRRQNAPDMRDAIEAFHVVAPGMHRAAWNAAKMAFRTNMPQMLMPGSKMEGPIEAIPGKTGRIVRLSGRLLRFGDEFAKRIAYELNMAEIAYAKAKTEGKTGADRIARARTLAAEPTTEMIETAISEARTETFTGKNGPLVQALQRLKVTPGWRYPVYAVLPFTSAPGQLTRTIVRRSPLGTIRMMYRGIRAAQGKGAYAGHGEVFVKDLAEQLVGAALIWLGLGLFRNDDNKEGRITGSQRYTNRPGERAMRYSDSPPTSIRIGDEWYSYNQLDPAAGQIQLWADTVDAIRGAKVKGVGEGAARVLESTKSLIRDKPFLQGVGEIVRAFEAEEKGDKAVAQYLAGLASSFAPRIWRDAWAATDPAIRDMSVRTKEDRGWTYARRAWQRSTPIPSLMPPAKRDLFGRPVSKGDVPGSDWVWRMVVPVRTQQARDQMNVERLIFNFNRGREDDKQLWPGLPSDNWTVGGKQYKMSEPEYDAFLARRGQLVLNNLKWMRINVAKPGWVDMQMVLTAFDQATRQARGEYESGRLSDTAFLSRLQSDIRDSRK